MALLAFQYVRASRPILGHVEYAGLIRGSSSSRRRLETTNWSIVESRDARTDVHVLALPLAYIYARNVLVLHSPRPDKAMLAAFLDGRARGTAACCSSAAAAPICCRSRTASSRSASDRFQVPEYDAPRERLSAVRAAEGIRLRPLRVHPAAAGGRAWFDLDVGVDDDLHVLRFHAKEQTEGRTFRWTRATSYVSVTVIHAGEPGRSRCG